MLARILALPLLVILAGTGAVAMYLPGVFAWATRDWASARAFIYSGTLFLVLLVLIAIATGEQRQGARSRSYLLAMLATFSVLPAMLALPVYEAMNGLPYFDAYLEMVSSLTTTGAPFLTEAWYVPPAVHLWRALVGWMGGLFVWVTALAILAPMNLGGFEVTGSAQIARGVAQPSRMIRQSDPSARLLRYTAQFFPIYGGLTLAVWLGLIVAGELPLVALCHAMSTLATSGISPLEDGLAGGGSGPVGEAVIFVFLVFALSRRTFHADVAGDYVQGLREDPEFRIGILVVAALPALLFLRHWIGGIDTGADSGQALAAWWGGVFTVMSFLTTTGFVSGSWEVAQSWSNLETPGMILVGLALVGGGVATTAGGVKLLRVYALYMHGQRELDRLVHPSSVGGSGMMARRIRRQGAYIAWIFFMLFAISIAIIMLALSMTGISFEASTVLAVATLSTTGPLATAVAEGIPSYASLPEAAKPVLAAAMVVGRLETLAFIALLNPAFWRS